MTEERGGSLEDPAQESLGKFMDFVADVDTFSQGWGQALVALSNPTSEHSLNPDELRETVREGGLPALKAKLLNHMLINTPPYFFRPTVGDLEAFIAYDGSQEALGADAIGQSEA